MLRHVWLLALAVCIGCGQTERAQAPTEEVEDVAITEADVQIPASYGEAMPRIKSYRDTIQTAIAAGTPGKAHRPLDELDIVLDKLPSIARESGIPKEKWEAINTASRELRSSFDQLHSAIDEKRQPDYQAVAEPIDRAIAQLEEVAR